jgi:hypothetical protein
MLEAQILYHAQHFMLPLVAWTRWQCKH